MDMPGAWKADRKSGQMGKALVSDDKFAADEIRFIIGISFILGLRQFGMMLVMPFLSAYGMTLSGTSSALVGLSALAFLYLVFVLREGVKADPALKTKKWTESKDALRNAIVNKPLLRLYVTGFLANFMLTGVFFIMPHIAGSSSGMDSLITLLIAIPVIIIAMKIANSYADRGKYSLVQIVIFSTFTLSIPCLFLRSTIINSVSIIIFFAGIMCQYYLITAGVNHLQTNDTERRSTEYPIRLGLRAPF